ncbi:PTS mannose transporter subunit IIA [Lactobacillus crispatus]|uniref:PTS sugar transporter subunit IIA n=1 Tax=Lactobacillus crispatus TaxID=47770 RepID=UPI0015EC9AE1|nr:PTS mannose transporter subunit IIA [Lactobacillus crispatus]MBA2915427.1 PTS mannose transporter subunit IIA [Lactobacillus crispatus]
MRKIILATHGMLSEAFKSTLELLYGTVDNIDCFCMTKEKSDTQAKKELNELISKSDENELIVLTDLLGGSPANICTEMIMRGHKFRLLAGLNLPMLLTLETIIDSDMSIDQIINKIQAEGKDGVKNINKIIQEAN